MTHIDFYITAASNPDELLSFACRLTEKAYRSHCDIYLHTESEQQMLALDEKLWSFRANSFLPHSHENSGSEDIKTKKSDATPAVKKGSILIAHSGNVGEHHDVLINLTDKTPKFFSRFDRLAEIVSGIDTAKEKSRQRYKYYRDRGYPLKVHNL
ncbi:MAG: hypothetical protein CBD32_02540 [Actinobacteria bacterium TMED172]|nr:DNA polymerase III subunit chi [Cellvibrionales bacterium]OUW33351.1 MAG: hypothetical protein CBD32_02540 [Actinobacteria bacterium TMED172]|tara:strand:- start:22118 stop:22582 length:465 start_codon:yes stop_codon:yes gene_type:complete